MDILIPKRLSFRHSKPRNPRVEIDPTPAIPTVGRGQQRRKAVTKRSRWTGEDKLQITLNVLQGEGSIKELCERYQISQKQYYQWRDRLFKEGSRLFDFGGPAREEIRLKAEIHLLKTAVRELKAELKRAPEAIW